LVQKARLYAGYETVDGQQETMLEESSLDTASANSPTNEADHLLLSHIEPAKADRRHQARQGTDSATIGAALRLALFTRPKSRTGRSACHSYQPTVWVRSRAGKLTFASRASPAKNRSQRHRGIRTLGQERIVS